MADISDMAAGAFALLWLPLAVVVGFIAHRRGRFGYVWFLLSMVVTPYVAGPILLVTPKLPRLEPPSASEAQSAAMTVLPRGAAPVDAVASTRLRLAFVGVAAVMAALWGWSLVPPIQNWGNPNEDGFSYLGFFWASIVCLPVGYLLVAGAIAPRGRLLARARNALLIGVAVIAIVVGFLIFQFVANSFGGLGLG